MNSPSRRYSHPYRIRAAYWAVALALGSFSGSLAQAATVGHARVVSAPGAPLQVVVPLADLTPEEQASLQISVPPATAWQRAGVVPPVPVDSLRVRVLPGAQANRKTVRLESTQPIATSTVEVLLDLRSQSGSRQVQVTILVPQRASATPVQSARVGDVDPARGAAVTTTVRAGDNLFRIARRYEVPDANIIQMLVAIWRANPEVFIQNNMNLLRTGERLTIPDAATIRAVDPAQAQRIYLQHLEEFAQYRGRAGAQVASAAAVGNAGSADAGQVSATPAVEHKAAPVAQDRLKLSASNPTQAQEDVRTSGQHALQDARLRVETLEGNVQALNEAAKAQALRENGGVSPTTVPGQSSIGGSSAGAEGQVATTGVPSQGADPNNVAGQGGAAGAGQAGVAAGSGTVGGSAAGSDAARTNAGGSNAQGAEAASSASGSAAAGSLAAGGSTVTGSSEAGSAVPGSPATDSSSVGSSAAGSPMAGSSAAGAPATGSGAAGSAAGSSGTGGGSSAGSNAANSTPGGVGTPGSYGAPGTTSPAGAASASSGDGLALPGGPSRATTEAEAQDLAAAAGGAASQSNASTGNWLVDNLLAIVTAALALIVLIIAWMMRRAGARRADENEDAAYGEQVVDTAMLTRKLEGIDLNLDTPPSDETPPRNPRP